MKFTGRITLTNVADGKDAVSYDIEFRLVRGEDSQALSALNLSATDLKDASVQALFYRNGEAYDAPKARMWTVDKAGAVLGIPAELSGSSGSVADAGLLYIGEETAYVICRMLDADGSVLCERSLPILLNGEDGKPVTVTGDVAQYAQTETSAQPEDSAFADAMPEPVQGRFMWTKRTVTYSDGKESKSYSVSRIGADGAGGSTTHFAYATSADGSQGFSTTNFSGAAYIGTYTDDSLVDSTDYTKYKWTRWVGAQGPKGDDGAKGDTGAQGPKGDDGTSVAITGTETVYQASSSGTETPSGDWLASVPALTDAKPFLWTRSTVTYSDGTNAVSYSVSYKGADGRSVSSIKEQYYLSSSSSGLAGGSWEDSPQPWADGKFFWTRSVIAYSDGSSATTNPVCVSGGQGASGGDGRGVASVDVEYYQSTSSSELAGGTWGTDAPAWASGKYVWQRTKTTYTDGSSAYTEPACLTGEKGTDGNGIRSTVTRYAQIPEDEASVPDGEWRYTDAPPAHADGWVIWMMQVTTYTDGTTSTIGPTRIEGNKGDKGDSGKDGLSYAPNLITGGKSFNTSFYKLFTLGKVIKGDTFAVAIEGSSGSSSEHNVAIYDNRGYALSNVVVLNEGNGYGGVLRVTVGSSAGYLRVYAGTDGQAQSGNVQFSGLVVVAGDTPAKPWRPSISEMKGDKGDKGDPGTPGDKGDSVTITDKSVKYAASASGTTVPDDGEWQTGIPSLTDAKPFMWTRVVITYNGANGSTTSYSVAYKGRNGTNGNNGTSVTITDKSVLYAISSSGTAAPSTDWQPGVPEATKDKPFVWTRTTVNYSDGTTTVAYSVGRIGSDGKGISTTKTMFGASSSPETEPTSWSETEPELGDGEYLWTKEVTTYTDGTTSEAVPVVSLDYLSRVIRKGRSALMGGLVLGNILAAADASGDVRSFLSGLLNLPALGLGVSAFGLSGYKAVTELNHDGSGHVGRFRFETRKNSAGDDEASSSVGFEDADGKMRIVLTSDAVPNLSQMTSATQSETKSYSGALPGDSIEQGETILAATGALTVANDGSRLTVAYQATNGLAIYDKPDFVSFQLIVYRDGYAYASLVSRTISWNDAGVVLRGSVVLGALAGSYDVRMRAFSNRGSSIGGSISLVGSMSVYFDGSEQKVVLGRDGLMAYHSPNSYVEMRRNASGQPLNVSGIQIGAGWGFGVLWMGYVDEDSGILKSTGPLRAKGKGGMSKSSSDYTITFPGNNSTVGTDYAVFCQPAKSSADGRYATVYGKTSSSFHVVTRWGDSQRDASFYFMVVSMKGWY